MKIIVDGYKNLAHFTCANCGCEFEASQYELHDYVSVSTIHCPYCNFEMKISKNMFGEIFKERE